MFRTAVSYVFAHTTRSPLFGASLAMYWAYRSRPEIVLPDRTAP